MAYIGREPTNSGQFLLIDDISSNFNGSNTSFNLTIGGNAINPSKENILIALDGVLQQSDEAYAVTGSQITFTEAPGGTVSFYGVLTGESQFIANESISNDKISPTANISGSKINTDFSAQTVQAKIFSGMVSSSAQIASNISGSFSQAHLSSKISGIVSASSIASSAQGEVALTTNGVAASAVDLGLQTSDSVQFSSVQANGGVTVDNITIDGTEIDLSSGDLTVDVAGNIVLDADGAQIRLEDNGTEFGRFSRVSSDLVIKSMGNNNDILFKGVDGSATITALQLDMSDAGTAIFNNDVTIAGTLTAQEIHTEFTSASIMFSSGSTKFGDTIDDTHEVTGSMTMSGSVTINDGTFTVTDNVDFNGDLDVDGTTNLDVVDIDGDVDIAPTASIGKVLADGNISSPSAPAFAFDNDTNTGLVWGGNDTLGIVTGGTRHIELRSNGEVEFAQNVGIGTTDPDGKLDVRGKVVIDPDNNISQTTSQTLYVNADGDPTIGFGIRGNGSGAGIAMGIDDDDSDKFKISNHPTDIGTAANLILSVDSNRVVSIGSANTIARVGQKLAVTTGGGSDRGGLAVNSFLNDTNGPLIDFNRSRSNTIGTHNNLSSGDGIGGLIFRGSDGDEFVDAAAIVVEADGSTANNDMPGRLQFFTTPDGTNSLVERMRITNAGRVGINTTAPEALLHVSGSQGSGAVALFERKNQADNTGYMVSMVNDDTTSNQGAGLNLKAGNDSGDVTFNATTRNGTYGIRMLGDGKVGIGTDNPQHLFEVFQDASSYPVLIKQNQGDGLCLDVFASASDQASNDAIIRARTNHATLLELMNDGRMLLKVNHLICAGAFIPGATGETDNSKIFTSSGGTGSTNMFIGNAQIQVSSDKRLKINIRDTEMNPIETLNRLRVVDFDWDDPKDTSWNNKMARVKHGGQWSGILAQEAVEVVPHIINAPRIEETLELDHESKNTWQVEYEHLVPTLVKAIQELSQKNEALEKRIEELEK